MNIHITKYYSVIERNKLDTHSSLHESQNHYVDWYDSVYIAFLKWQNCSNGGQISDARGKSWQGEYDWKWVA